MLITFTFSGLLVLPKYVRILLLAFLSFKGKGGALQWNIPEGSVDFFLPPGIGTQTNTVSSPYGECSAIGS